MFESVAQIGTTVVWHPKEQERAGKLKDVVYLGIDAKGWYCEECMKVFGAFDQR